MQSGETFDVVVLGFEPRTEPPEARLERVFGLDTEHAIQLIAELPRAVQHGVPRVRAEYFRRALLLCGARVEVRDHAGQPLPALEASDEPAERSASNATNPYAASAEADVHPLDALPALPPASTPFAATTAIDSNAPRAAAHPTLREAAAELRQLVDKSASANLAAATLSLPDNSRTQLDAASAEVCELPQLPDVLAPRVPSSVWDPPPAASVAASAQPAFDLARSIVGPGLWRPPPSGEPVAAPARAAAIALEPAENPDELGMIPAWDLPQPSSMAEPKRRVPISRPAAAQRAPEARELAKRAAPAQRAVSNPQPPRNLHPRKRADARPSRPRAAAETSSFFAELGPTLALPFGGAGPHWIAAVTASAIVVALLDALRSVGFGAGMIAVVCVHSALLALACDFYRNCFWAELTAESPLEHRPDFDPSRIIDRYFKSGIHLLLLAFVLDLPTILWLVHATQHGDSLRASLFHPVSALALLPLCYWPMAIGTAAIDNNFAAVWNLRAGVRAIARAPLEYLAILAIGGFAFGAIWTGLLAFGSLFGLSGALLSGTVGLPLAISHGLEGALMGRLARARSELFE